MNQKRNKRFLKIIFSLLIMLSCFGLNTTVFAMDQITDKDTLCSYDFGNINKLGDPNKDYSTNITNELSKINELYTQCMTGIRTYPEKKCYAIGIPNSDQAACGGESAKIMWTFPANMTGNFSSCETGREDAYKLVASLYCPAESQEEYENIEANCAQCEGYNYQIPGPTYNPGFPDFCHTNYKICQQFSDHDDDATNLEDCISACDGKWDQVACEDACHDMFPGESVEEPDDERPLPEDDTNYGNVDCSSLGELVAFAQDIFNVICILMGVGAVVLGMMDYTKAVMSADQDAMKKATKHFTTRLIILAIMLLLPLLIDWLLGIIMPAILDVDSFDSCIGMF